MVPIDFTFALQTGTGGNQREHHMVRARRVKAERAATGRALRKALGDRRHVGDVVSLPARVTITRVSPGNGCDDDGVSGGAKGVRDAIAAFLWIDDGGPWVRWSYAQERGPWGVRVTIEAVEQNRFCFAWSDAIPGRCISALGHPGEHTYAPPEPEPRTLAVVDSHTVTVNGVNHRALVGDGEDARGRREVARHHQEVQVSTYLDMIAVHAVLADVAVERERQRAKFGDQSTLPMGTGHPQAIHERGAAKRRCAYAVRNGGLTFSDILEEEFWEAMAEEDPARLEAELIQVAAVAVQMIEALRRKR